MRCRRVADARLDAGSDTPASNPDQAAAISLNRCFLGIWHARAEEDGAAARDAQALRIAAQRVQRTLWADGVSVCALTISIETGLRHGDKGLRAQLDSLHAVMSAGPYLVSQLLWGVLVIESADLFERAGDKQRAYLAIKRRNAYGRLPAYLAYQLKVEARLALSLGRKAEGRTALRHYLVLVDRPDRNLASWVSSARKQLEIVGQ